MLQNARVTAFTVSELLRENQQGELGVKLPHIPRLTRFKFGFVKPKNLNILLSHIASVNGKSYRLNLSIEDF